MTGHKRPILNLARAASLGLTVGLWLAPCGAVGVFGTGIVRGTTTAQDGSVRLPGVEVRVVDAATGREASVVVSDGEGCFQVTGLAAARYRLVAHLPGFTDATTDVQLADGQHVEVALDLALAPLWERVNVTAQAEATRLATGSSPVGVKGSMLDVLPIVPGSFQAALPIVPGVVRAPDGQISVKGARPTQGGLQVGMGSAIDPSTGAFGVTLPSEAIESVEVVGNPYGTRDGGFQSSMVKVETRAGANEWQASARGLVPFLCLKMCDGDSMGVRRYEPRVWLGGPLGRDRLFLAQGFEYRWNRFRVPSLPEAADDFTNRSLDVFTRLDWNIASGHALTATAGLFSRDDSFANLNTFNPQEVSPDFGSRGTSVTVSENATLSPATVLESAVSVNLYNVNVSARGEQAMELTPNGNAGNFFNTQDRRTRSLQWTEAITRLHRGAFGEHLLNAGIDVAHASYAGTSVSRPVVVRRADGTIGERREFGTATAQRVAGTSVAVHLQDRWRLSDFVLLEPGLRLDRDGVLRQVAFSPRVGAVLRPFKSDASVVRGGVGVFRQRTPLIVGAFESFEPATVARLATDGLTPLAPPVTFVHRTGRLKMPRSLIWNIEFDQRVGSSLFVKVNYLQRRGSGETIVEPIQAGDTAELRLDSRGTSRYAETEVTVRYGATEERRLTVSYVRSRSTTDSNAFELFYGNFRNPVVRPNQFALAPVDVPNRLLVSGVLPFRKIWTASVMVEVRNGFPYSIVDENQQFVGLPNTGGRFPAFSSLDARILRTMTIRGRRFRFGLRTNHLLNTFSPRDVQNNSSSPAFRTFYNSFPRVIAFTAQWIG